MKYIMDDNWFTLKVEVDSSRAKTWDSTFVSQDDKRTWGFFIGDKEFL
jgi:hypothetical protein